MVFGNPPKNAILEGSFFSSALYFIYRGSFPLIVAGRDKNEGKAYGHLVAAPPPLKDGPTAVDTFTIYLYTNPGGFQRVAHLPCLDAPSQAVTDRRFRIVIQLSACKRLAWI